ncbi:hypothetical protein ACH4HG_29460 [Streptomyces coeruleorubidus]|uniref:hypothetical protein n=1 Tax=Streptomyces coeruleorubidus TaxID=116188 RepID=UPI00378F95FA
MRRLISGARTAFARGDATFVAGFGIDTRARVSTKAVRKEMDKTVTAVEPIGWECFGVQPFLSTVHIDFAKSR